jgi:hypothetical protein
MVRAGSLLLSRRNGQCRGMQWWEMLGISTACKFPTHSKGFLGFMNETNQIAEINQTSRLSAIYWHNIVGSSVSCFEQKSMKIADSPIFALSGSCGISRFRPRSSSCLQGTKEDSLRNVAVRTSTSCDMVTLNQRAVGSTPTRPTKCFSDLHA